ncbi:conserved exported protein of unknown function (plasmid) [Cupriavidus taiwanensis]|uniref:Lipoprotein n=1 Tax=Cupriavidus taiwanensis TaxID=164546 RepID=A0A375IMQ5_9BURK|nr:hypothetical protein [Cupriavidus taiwanensis]SPK75973.1 conserved exported protein of unknown function [Cupriavidus taiwanensis]
MKTAILCLCTLLTVCASFTANAGPDWQIIEKARAQARQHATQVCDASGASTTSAAPLQKERTVQLVH